MKGEKKIFLFLVICFFIYFSVSILQKNYSKEMPYFNNINLIGELFRTQNQVTKPKKIVQNNKGLITKENRFEIYRKGDLITDFISEKTASLPRFNEKLHQLEIGENRKIRIAYFGDSMIEGDLLTQTLRKLLQAKYGGAGVGFVSFETPTSHLRQSVKTNANNWTTNNFKKGIPKNLYISGYNYSGLGQVNFKDNTLYNSTLPIEKAIIYGKNTDGSIVENFKTIKLNGKELVNRQVLNNKKSNNLSLSSNDENTLFYGLSFETQYGIFVDNFSFRGVSGNELNKMSVDFLKSVQKNNPYDLIVFQYGVNLLFRPNDTNFDYYKLMFEPVIDKFKKAFPESEILLVSCADRAFRYDGSYKTAIGLPQLLELQAQMSFDKNIAFYNLYQSMGGNGSIVNWANQTPALANKDYIHPNAKGAEVLGTKIFEAFQNDYKKYLQTHK